MKSHEVARFRYTKLLNDNVGGFDRRYFILSCNVMRVITFPDSLNGETGLVCSYLGSVREFSRMKVYEILDCAKACKGLTSRVNFVSMDKVQVFPRLH